MGTATEIFTSTPAALFTSPLLIHTLRKTNGRVWHRCLGCQQGLSSDHLHFTTDLYLLPVVFVFSPGQGYIQLIQTSMALIPGFKYSFWCEHIGKKWKRQSYHSLVWENSCWRHQFSTGPCSFHAQVLDLYDISQDNWELSPGCCAKWKMRRNHQGLCGPWISYQISQHSIQESSRHFTQSLH